MYTEGCIECLLKVVLSSISRNVIVGVTGGSIECVSVLRGLRAGV